MELYNECCLQGMKRIPDKSVNLILTDLPYGSTIHTWDKIIDVKKLFKEMRRVVKEYGNIILFGKQPFTSLLTMEGIDMFRYSLVWKKSRPGGFVFAPYKPLSSHEDILVFSRAKFTCNAKNRMVYHPIGSKPVEILRQGHNRVKSTYTRHKTNEKPYVQKRTNYPRSVLEYPSVFRGHCIHPTQKPVNLMEWLVEAYSNQDDLVLDCCFGSGTTAVACKNKSRRFIGFEKDKTYFDLAKTRIDRS